MQEIKEIQLLEYKQTIDEILYLNKISFSSEYKYESDEDLNSTISYFCDFPHGFRSGMICHVKNGNKFGGFILKTEMVRYLEMEGFNDEQVEREPVFAIADSVEKFVMMLAYPKHGDIIFAESD
jgi:hypothetical protein